ncbi:hypothetical protein [Roseovarius sp. E0-M6]|uniref:hypothetical protein n=1 Tax=Roseovarius sp. E0-M6 TaxID=3127118 RepID=UPI00301023A1
MNSHRLSTRSIGQFSPKNWLQEGDGLFASSRKTREVWEEHRRQFSKTVADEGQLRFPERAGDMTLLTGLPRASMLLLGYAVEMYLKAGIAKAYVGCAENMFSRDIRKRFGHHFSLMAEELCFPLSEADRKNLERLKKMVLVDARYPVEVGENETHASAVNNQTSRIWSKDSYDELADLVKRVNQHSRLIDSDENDPANICAFDIDQDGYLAFRVGGRLPPRITYKISSAMRANGESTTVADIKALFHPEDPRFTRILHYWDHSFIYEDGHVKQNGHVVTKCHSRPASENS